MNRLETLLTVSVVLEFETDLAAFHEEAIFNSLSFLGIQLQEPERLPIAKFRLN